ncbi:peptide-methionine (S)-S-oxide reductase MsrA [Companilactobacillus bobalius]|uniref:peptide-methionine (S)-S-oxide reductase MsrA n=1 Tax=Companilactobacillus bobalius TaxID=2801451 RepID=UPI0013024499|nr:peptide-methionine (S)-S-oxide reductase MsrA [Companilactobacillus bobalius]KAE9560476.1 methionine sulfoxide reductase A [Companilactobacillus bobalius]
MKEETAIFAGGCFWCMVSPFDQQPGIISVISGYTGGLTKNREERLWSIDFIESRRPRNWFYDADVISYQQLVETYWQVADPTDAMGQFQDRGDNYRPVIYYANEEQKAIAEKSKEDLAKSGEFDDPIVTQILPAKPFYDAEDYHQDFYKKNPLRYELEESGGRGEFIKKHRK